ncbi:PTS alpha-glucoside transporter subunit IIBC, partial [Staphylococcus cohnii]
IFTGIYFVVFRFLILKFNIPLPGRDKEKSEVKLYSKQDYKEKQGANDSVYAATGDEYTDKANYYLQGLGGAENIKDVTNCATRLRLTVKDQEKVEDNDYFIHNQMAHGLVKSGKNVQVIVGMSVPQVREAFENMVFTEDEA